MTIPDKVMPDPIRTVYCVGTMLSGHPVVESQLIVREADSLAFTFTLN
jgi:hypothetical protein